VQYLVYACIISLIVLSCCLHSGIAPGFVNYKKGTLDSQRKC